MSRDLFTHRTDRIIARVLGVATIFSGTYLAIRIAQGLLWP